MSPQPTSEDVYRWLEDVKDPEIPVLSLVDLGVINNIQVTGNSVHIDMTPTFVGCPALDMMQADIREKLLSQGISQLTIDVNFRHHWTSDRISARGREALRRFGLAPPPDASALITDLDVLEHAQCPRCGGTDTALKTPFGATLCRSIHYCHHCREAFEQFKPL